MAIAANHLETGSDAVDATIFTTGSVTPASNALVLLAVTGERVAGASAAPTVAGNSLTWVAIDSEVYATIGSPLQRISLFRAMGASPSSGVVTVTFAAEQTRMRWSLMEFTGVDTGGSNGADAVVQTVKANGDSQSTPFIVTLAAFSDANNATYGGFGGNQVGNLSAGTGFTMNSANPVTSQYKLSNDTTVDFSFDGTGTSMAALACEIKAPAAGGGNRGAHGRLGFSF